MLTRGLCLGYECLGWQRKCKQYKILQRFHQIHLFVSDFSLSLNFPNIPWLKGSVPRFVNFCRLWIANCAPINSNFLQLITAVWKHPRNCTTNRYFFWVVICLKFVISLSTETIDSNLFFWSFNTTLNLFPFMYVLAITVLIK